MTVTRRFSNQQVRTERQTKRQTDRQADHRQRNRLIKFTDWQTDWKTEGLLMTYAQTIIIINEDDIKPKISTNFLKLFSQNLIKFSTAYSNLILFVLFFFRYICHIGSLQHLQPHTVPKWTRIVLRESSTKSPREVRCSTLWYHWPSGMTYFCVTLTFVWPWLNFYSDLKTWLIISCDPLRRLTIYKDLKVLKESSGTRKQQEVKFRYSEVPLFRQALFLTQKNCFLVFLMNQAYIGNFLISLFK